MITRKMLLRLCHCFCEAFWGSLKPRCTGQAWKGCRVNTAQLPARCREVNGKTQTPVLIQMAHSRQVAQPALLPGPMPPGGLRMLCGTQGFQFPQQKLLLYSSGCRLLSLQAMRTRTDSCGLRKQPITESCVMFGLMSLLKT